MEYAKLFSRFLNSAAFSLIIESNSMKVLSESAVIFKNRNNYLIEKYEYSANDSQLLLSLCFIHFQVVFVLPIPFIENDDVMEINC